MTSKDYVAIAEIIADPTLHLQDSKRMALADRFSIMLAADNHLFDIDRFKAACFPERDDWRNGWRS